MKKSIIEKLTLAFGLSASLLALSIAPVIGQELSAKQNKPAKTDAKNVKTKKNTSAQKVQPFQAGMTLEQALAAAYNNNPEIKAQRESAKAVDETVPEAMAGWRPTMDMEASYYKSDTHNRGGQVNALDKDYRNKTNFVEAGVVARYNIFSGGNTVSTVQRNVADAQAAHARVYEIEQKILFETVETFVKLLTKTEEVRLRRVNEDALRQNLKAVTDKYNVGEETKTSVAQSNAKLADARAQTTTAMAQEAALKADFTRLTGLVPTKLIKPKVMENLLPKTLEEAIKIGLQNNPTLTAAKFDADSAYHQKGIATSGLFPRVDLEGRTTYNNANNLGLRSTDAQTTGVELTNKTTHDQFTQNSVRLSVSMPLYEGGKIRAQRANAAAVSEQKRITIDTVMRKITDDIITAWRNFFAFKANLVPAREQVESNKVALSSTEQELLVGSKIILDVLNARTDLVQSEVAFVNTEGQYIISYYQLRQAMGQLTAQGLKLKVPVYNPIAHYDEVRNDW